MTGDLAQPFPYFFYFMILNDNADDIMSFFKRMYKAMGFGRKRLAIERDFGDDIMPVVSEYLPVKSRVNLVNTGLVKDKDKACVPEGLIWRDLPNYDGDCVLGKRKGSSRCCEEQNLQFIKDAVNIYLKTTNLKENRTLRRALQWLDSIEDTGMWLSNKIVIKNNEDGRHLLKLAVKYKSRVRFNVYVSDWSDFEQLLPFIKSIPGQCLVYKDFGILNSIRIPFAELQFLAEDNTQLSGFECHLPVIIPDNLPFQTIAGFVDMIAHNFLNKVLLKFVMSDEQFVDMVGEMTVEYHWEIVEDDPFVMMRRNVNQCKLTITHSHLGYSLFEFLPV